MITKVLQTLRNNWKKTVFFSGCMAFASKYIIKWQREDEVMRDYCLKAREYGRQTLKQTERPRKVVVFLNPAAKDGKTKYLLEKHVLPLLHLAGLEVHVVRTEHEGQAKAYMGVLDNNIVDAIIVAGGDGTVSEIVTGLLRRNDDLAQKIPIGVLPLGNTNTFTSTVFPKEDLEVLRFCKASLAVIENSTKPYSVLEVTPDLPEHNKNVYLMSTIRWGAHSDIELAKRGKYWYMGPMKDWYCYMKKAYLGTWPPVVKADLELNANCSGCSTCLVKPAALKPAQKSWWWGPKQTVPEKTDHRLEIENKECGLCENKAVETLQLNIQLNHSQDLKDPEVQIQIAPEETKSEFVDRKGSVPGECCVVGGFKLIPKTANEGDHPFMMDSEKFEPMPITVKLLRNKIRVFTPSKETSTLETR